jgi:hypothetical protein
MQPHIVISWTSLLLSIVAAFFFGYLWYGPLFGKPWAKAMGISMTRKPKRSEMTRGFALQIVGLFLTAYVLAHSEQVWRASSWGFQGKDLPNSAYAFYAGVFTWLGFYVPQQFSKVAWENRPWKLFFINTAYEFLNLQLIAQILACCHH